ncbi:MAG: hypothetical protein UV38_C0001G0015 [candidate division TM6 bacterium GW2011_GWE2_42_60]|nr:MAG: hypothetical protein UV38_C0001G0015 [candidate division TM6 bacterium GW2011_GWE2_42_60]HBY05789.1 hypothetical protein [Candidatus Dependentiae bacterium]
MNKNIKAVSLVICFCGLIFCIVVGCPLSKNIKTVKVSMETQEKRDALNALFPKTVRDIERRIDDTIWTVQKELDSILDKPAHKRTFENTIRATDLLIGRISETGAIFSLVHMVHPEATLRDASYQGLLKLESFSIDVISTNKKLYAAFKEYAENNGSQEALTAEQRFYLQESLGDFERSGLALPDAQLEEVRKIQKELSQLSLDFESNINKDLRTVTVPKEQLTGLSDSFIAGLKKDENDAFILRCDRPTFFAVTKHCTNAETREKVWIAFENCAYPENGIILKKIIALRDQLAHKLGFSSYAHLNISDQMAKTPERVSEFLSGLQDAARKKAHEELELWTKNLPDGVALTIRGEIMPWDMEFIKEHYKKTYLAVDTQKIKEYFPVQRTVDELLSLYEHFLGVEFRQEQLEGLWHEDVRYITAFNSKGELLGHLLLDLFPRDFKYTHACQMTLIPTVRNPDGTRTPAILAIIANFPKASPEHPALLPFDEVKTFFHEFGHAMHALMGATEMRGFSGTATKLDFVETPSQMFECWLSEPTVLKRVSSHYKTGEPLDDATIQQLTRLEQFDSGNFVIRQAGLARFALACFAEGEDKDFNALKKESYHRLNRGLICAEDREHFECSFGHLIGYGARYYSYLWSKVFAIDLFDCIKERGLFNTEVGKQFVETILSKGGSIAPEILMQNFLGRAPSQAAFLRRLESEQTQSNT